MFPLETVCFVQASLREHWQLRRAHKTNCMSAPHRHSQEVLIVNQIYAG